MKRAALSPTILLALAVLFVPASSARADKSAKTWLRDHLLFDLAGTGGWRSGLGLDERAPGFESLIGGGEIVLGLEITAPVGIFTDGRIVAGGLGGNLYLEGLGGAGVQVHVARLLRLRLGATAGQASLAGDRAILVGGMLAGAIELFPWGHGRLATELLLRLDLDAHLHAHKSLPDQSMALALGVGFKY